MLWMIRCLSILIPAMVPTKSDCKNQGSLSKGRVAMETNRLGLNCLLWPFLFCHCLFRRNDSTMLRSLELSATSSSTVLNTIDSLSCLVLTLENAVAVEDFNSDGARLSVAIRNTVAGRPLLTNKLAITWRNRRPAIHPNLQRLCFITYK